ncbi:MAG: SPOR domain-containing protein [Trichloromonas sp.]|nr:SPOR domain-containing protein [Trichloromonas sp.]
MQSRTQRRMEKKHAILLLVLLLGISLVSFFLGIMVGRGSSGTAVAPIESVTPPLPVPPPLAESLPVVESPSTPAALAVPVVEGAADKPALTFYEALPKGEQPPLGSGINLPPPEKPKKPEASAAKQEPAPLRPPPPVPPVAVTAAPAASAAATGATEVPAPTVKVEAPPTPLPKPVAQGTFVVQAASFKTLSDATALRDRLIKKGYGAYVQEANLGDKGVWQRVIVGPYAGNEAVSQVVERLKNEERLSGMIKKQ